VPATATSATRLAATTTVIAEHGRLGKSVSDTATAGLRERIEAIEGGYELFLSYAAKGSKGGLQGGDSSVRGAIDQMDRALEGLGEFLVALVRARSLEPPAAYDGFIAVLSQDRRQPEWIGASAGGAHRSVSHRRDPATPGL
jgi:hypothetical protein